MIAVLTLVNEPGPKMTVDTEHEPDAIGQLAAPA